MKSVMVHSFAQVPDATIPRSSFNRSHGYKSVFNAGYLVPVFMDEALPGDTFNLRMTSFSRLATPAVPIMDNLFLDSFFFAVPVRLIWENWQAFNGEQEDPDPSFSASYAVPEMTSPASTGYATGSLSDYLGLPVGVAELDHSALWHRAYNLIWNEWFRDQNLQNSVEVDKGDSNSDPADYVLLRRGKRHDYFTSCLPWPQKALPVNLPLGTTAPIIQDPTPGAGVGVVIRDDLNALAPSLALQSRPTTAVLTDISNTPTLHIDPNGTLFADLTNATAATINQLREAFQVQKLYERDARGGTRYTEIIRAHFGVTSPDARLQRPEYLGGGTSPINIHPVPQTSSSDVTSPQGNLAAFGTATQQGHGFTKSFTEHCILLGMVSVRADLNYQQGMNRMFSRSTRFDFYWPSLSHLGEQPVLNKEIFCDGSSADEEVFGYQERYAEYRYKPSVITGLFRSNVSGSLDIWHLAQDFSGLPALDDDFIQEDPPLDRVLAVTNEPHILFDSYFSLQCARPMPVYSVPGLIDHF